MNLHTFGPWEHGYAAAPWYLYAICFLFGHRTSDTHPRVQDCRRCHGFRRKQGVSL